MRLLFDPHKVLLKLALLTLLSSFSTLNYAAESANTAAVENETAEKQACEVNLNLIFDAIHEYRNAHSGGLPAGLSELVPEFIADPKTLICPVERQTWSQRSWRVRGVKTISDPAFDPHASYTYEFNQTELPDSVWRGLPKRTWREFKQAQMAQMERLGLPGGLVPIVRCHRHELNLGFSGSVYPNLTGELLWEKKFAKSDKELEDLELAGRPFADRTEPRSLTKGDFAPRDSEASSQLLDLTAYYNAQLSDGWQGIPSNDLSKLPHGLQRFNGVPFDIRGVIQLGGAEATVEFPNRIDGIAVRQRFKRLNVLHAATFPFEESTNLASYVIQYANGQTNEIRVVYGQNIADWWFNPKDDPKGLSLPRDAQVAWEGNNPAVEAYGKAVRLYQMSWDNPLPDIEVVSISLVSRMDLSAPFVIAITVDP